MIIRNNGRAHGSLLYVFCMHSIVAPALFHLADHQLDNMLYSSHAVKMASVLWNGYVDDGSKSCMDQQSASVYSLENV